MIEVIEEDSGGANGLAFDHDGRLLAAEGDLHVARRLKIDLCAALQNRQ